MKFSLFCHSLLSDWNHGNAHFLRGVVTELVHRGHAVKVYEAEDAWSPSQLVSQHGSDALFGALKEYPLLDITRYTGPSLNLEAILDDSDLAIVHEWTPPELVSRIGALSRKSECRVLFHDTHHRAVTAPDEMSRYDLSNFDGVLAFGEVLRQLYLSRGWADRVWTWHEAADARVFRPLPEVPVERDLVWVGNWGDDERVRELREFLIDPVAALALSARVHGVRYPESALADLSRAGIDYAGWLPNFEVPRAFARARVTVHVPRNPYVLALPGIPTIRPFEAMACGIPLISAPWLDSEGLFRAGQDYLLARNGREMTEHLRLLLNDTESARTLAEHGRASVLARHTCAHRVDELLSICREIGVGAKHAQAGERAAEPAIELTTTHSGEEALGLRLVGREDPRREGRFARVAAEFPEVRVEFVEAGVSDAASTSLAMTAAARVVHLEAAATIDAEEWSELNCDLAACDRAARAAATHGAWLTLRGDTFSDEVLFQVLTRYQRILTSKEAVRRDTLFARVLDRHHALHDLSKPLVRADFDHALDVWLWLLRLDPGASRALQWAALFHDVERLKSEADFRIEQHAPDYQAFKDAHAEEGARMTRSILRAAGVEESESAETAHWIVEHEKPHDPARSPELTHLADADALSFFSLNSPGFLDYYGPEHTRKKISYSLARMSVQARKLLTRVKLRADVRELLLQVHASTPDGVYASGA